MDKASWTEAFRKLDALSESCKWWQGDLICAGEKLIGEKWVAEQVNQHDDARTLWLQAAIAKLFTPKQRRQKLRWAHHHEVAFLPGEKWDKYLDKAEDEHLRHAELRDKVKRGEAECIEPHEQTSFKVLEWSAKLMSWVKRESKGTPIPQWPSEKKDYLRQALKPVVELYQQL